MGVSEQPEEVGGLLFKTRDVQITIAVIVTMQLLSLVGSGADGLPVAVTQHAFLYQLGFETQLPEGVVWATVCCALGAMGLLDLALARPFHTDDMPANRARCARIASAFLNHGEYKFTTADPDVTWWETTGRQLHTNLRTCLRKGKDVEDTVVNTLNVLVAQVRELMKPIPSPPGVNLAAACRVGDDGEEDDENGSAVDWDSD
jgi:hypothetical protein